MAIGNIEIGNTSMMATLTKMFAVGIKNVSVVIAPYDMRKGRNLGLERSPLK